MKKIITISNINELTPLIDKVKNNIESTIDTFKDYLKESNPYQLFHDIKFKPIGHDPLELSKLNFIEQVNQTFTYLVTFEAVKYLFEKHKDHAPFILNLGTAGGTDIISEDGMVAAEVFAAVNPSNNQKLKKDCGKVVSEAYEDAVKYVFFYAPEKFDVKKYEKDYGLRVVQLYIG